MYPLPPVKKTFMHPPQIRALCVRRVARAAKSKHDAARVDLASACVSRCAPPPDLRGQGPFVCVCGLPV